MKDLIVSFNASVFVVWFLEEKSNFNLHGSYDVRYIANPQWISI